MWHAIQKSIAEAQELERLQLERDELGELRRLIPSENTSDANVN
jgi:hypothetical protein